MNLIDVHCHLDKTFFPDGLDHIIAKAKANDIKVIIANGIDKKTNREVLSLIKQYPIIKPALGIYPIDKLELETNEKSDFNPDDELEFIKNNIQNIIAIGECGLDFSEKDAKKDQQIHIFNKLIKIAKNSDKPIIVHSRKAEKEVIDILERSEHKKIVMHCFSGNHKLVDCIRKNGWYFSIPTNIVRSEHFQKLVKETPLNQILTETDAPFLSPFKEIRNEPSYIIETIKKIAELKHMDRIEVANIIFMNYQKLFL